MAKLIEPGITKGEWLAEPTGDHKRIIIGKGLVEGPNGYDVAKVYSDDCPQAEAAANAKIIAVAPRVARSLVEMISFYELACNHGDFGYPEQEAMAKRALDALLSAGYTESPDVK